MQSHRLQPSAAVLIESMRDIGYSLETALADIIDNSITAKARNIRIRLDPDQEQPCIGIIDDGMGMSEEELLAAMRPGSRSPLDNRDSNDLGRFGLGLKTASFSQCRRLTVVSRLGGDAFAATWDLDHVVAVDDWLVQIPDDLDAIPYVEELGETGTLVLWEKLDRITEETDVDAITHITERLDDACRHMELVFHRFLSGESPIKKVRISVNGRQLKPMDPFCSLHDATIPGPEEVISVGGQRVVVQSFTLPHHSKVSREEWERVGRREGYVKNQGFYVYRAKRLIISGTWFGLMKQSELTKLARVRVDMPNSLDSFWKIDVKKASAQPPMQIRTRLRRIIERFGTPSKKVYRQRGIKQATGELCPTWIRIADKEGLRYEINLTHPVISHLTDSVDPETAGDILAALKLVQAAIPVEMIHADASDHPCDVGRPELNQEEFATMVRITHERLCERMDDPEKASEFIRSSEPFASAGEILEEVLAQITGKRRGSSE